MRIFGTLFLVLIVMSIKAQDHTVELPIQLSDNSVKWPIAEREYYSEVWMTQVVTNVSTPSMEVYLPDSDSSSGTAVIIAPGGGLYAQSIENEGREVAKWFVERGVAAFVLKYRLVPTGQDGTMDIMTDGENGIREKTSFIFPLAISDGLMAITHVRENAQKYGVNANQIGFMGFSAGGAVTMGVGYNYQSAADRPDFIAPVYAWTTMYPVQDVPEDAPPMFVICAADDPLDLAPGNVELYTSWYTAEKPVELHMYQKGGHGFGMKKQDLPVDGWISAMGSWMAEYGWMK